MDRYRPICTSKDGRSNWRAVMQIVRPHTTIDSDVELWVKESDVEALQARVRELEEEVSQLSEEVTNARDTMHGEIRYNTELRNRVRELEEQLRNSIPKPVVMVVQRNAGHDYCYSVSLNGVFLVTLDSHDTNQFSAEDECRAIAKAIRQALGLEGGGDE